MSMGKQNQYLDYLIDPSIQEVNILFFLAFEDNTVRTAYTEWLLPKVEIKEYNVMNDGQNVFDQLEKHGT